MMKTKHLIGIILLGVIVIAAILGGIYIVKSLLGSNRGGPPYYHPRMMDQATVENPLTGIDNINFRMNKTNRLTVSFFNIGHEACTEGTWFEISCKVPYLEGEEKYSTFNLTKIKNKFVTENVNIAESMYLHSIFEDPRFEEGTHPCKIWIKCEGLEKPVLNRSIFVEIIN